MPGTGRPKHLPVFLFIDRWPPVPKLKRVKSGEKREVKRKKVDVTASVHTPPCDEIIVLKEKVAALEAWRTSTEADLKEIHDVVSQVKLLMSLSIGGGGLSILTLAVTFVLLVTGKR